MKLNKPHKPAAPSRPRLPRQAPLQRTFGFPPPPPPPRLKPRPVAVVHADGGSIQNDSPVALCYQFERGRLEDAGAKTCRMSANPREVTCVHCNAVLSERGQLYAIMLAKAKGEEL